MNGYIIKHILIAKIHRTQESLFISFENFCGILTEDTTFNSAHS